MRIISSFKDFYDFGSCYGIDTKIVYHRVTSQESWHCKNERIAKKLNRKYIKRFGENSKDITVFRVGYMIICDDVYPVIYKQFYNKYDVNQLSVSFDVKEKLKEIYSTNQELWFIRSLDVLMSEIDEVINHISTLKLTNEKSPVMFLNSADFVLTHNPRLLDFGAQHHLDANNLFQNISMFIGKMMNNRELTEIEDKYKIAERGFDDKSFRNTNNRMK